MSNSFLQCISNICGLELATLIKDYKYSLFGGHTAVVEGHKGIVEYSLEAIGFALHKGVLRVKGKNLRVKCMENGFAVVVGDVACVEVSHDK